MKPKPQRRCEGPLLFYSDRLVTGTFEVGVTPVCRNPAQQDITFHYSFEFPPSVILTKRSLCHACAALVPQHLVIKCEEEAMNPEAPWWHMIEFPHFGERHRGLLVPAEHATGVPFLIARAYWIYSWDRGYPRGGHAHRRIQQVFCCLEGKLQVTVRYGGDLMEQYVLDQPHVGLWTAPLVWLDMEPQSRNTLLLVLASGPHDEGEYIRDEAEYRRLFAPRQDSKGIPSLVGVR